MFNVSLQAEPETCQEAKKKFPFLSFFADFSLLKPTAVLFHFIF